MHITTSTYPPINAMQRPQIKFAAMTDTVRDRFELLNTMTQEQLTRLQKQEDQQILNEIKRDIEKFTEIKTELLPPLQEKRAVLDKGQMASIDSELSYLRQDIVRHTKTLKQLETDITEQLPDLQRMDSLQEVIDFVADPDCPFPNNGNEFFPVLETCFLQRRLEYLQNDIL